MNQIGHENITPSCQKPKVASNCCEAKQKHLLCGISQESPSINTELAEKVMFTDKCKGSFLVTCANVILANY